LQLLDEYRPEDKLLDKYRPEDKLLDKEDAPTKRALVFPHGINTVTNLLEKKKAKLVIIANDVDPLEDFILGSWNLSLGTSKQCRCRG